jgi:hypothetical protein
MRATSLAAIAACITALLAPAVAQEEPPLTAVALDDFEAGTEGYRFVGGEEFPGAKGSMERDAEVAHGGDASLRLAADFSGGGAYVGVWREMPDLGGGFLRAIRLYARSEHVARVGVRLGDTTGQCHQAKAVPIEADGEWHELVLPIDALVGTEWWGGANDGKWHGPPTGLGLNIGKDCIEDGAAGTLWLDDIECLMADGPPLRSKLLAGELSQPACRPGFGADLTFRWDAEPMGRDFTVFVHFVDADGHTVFQGDHEPPVATSVWEGRVEYTNTIIVPTDAPDGDYSVVVGLYSHAAAARNWDHQVLETGEGVTAVDDGMSYEIAKLTIDANAPVPPLPAPTLDLTGYHVTFDEDFTEPLSVSAWGPGTRWIAHTPYSGDFGDAGFADPEEGFPFTIEDGILRIEAKKDGDRWRAGLLSSVDPKGEGFSQRLGYFECRAKFPKGKGVWPAFWLLGQAQLVDRAKTQIEIDVVEFYGVGPNALHTTVHLWYPDAKHWAEGHPSIVEGMTDEFHNYGVMVTEDDIIFYFDGVELRRMATPEEAKVPLYILVNLALGGGWPIDETPNPSHMYVDYVRAYAHD